jgi:hypothetical protein
MKRVLFFALVFFSGLGILSAQSFSWDDIEVYHHDIHLSVTDFSTKQISGHTTVTVVSAVNGLDSICLYLSKLQIDSIHLNGVSIQTFIHDNDSIIRIGLSSVINIHDTARVTVYYHGQPILDPSGFGGFYFSSDNLYAYNIGVAFSDDPHSYGRAWFPCVDSFTHKSLYDFYITTEAPKYAVCGGTMISKTLNLVNGTYLTHWKISQKTPPYLVSLAISDFIIIESLFPSVCGLIPVQIHVRQPDSLKAEGSFANLVNLLIGFEERFGNYRWDRVGYVGVPFSSGAMEHAMNIAYPRFAINGNLSYESLMAHELAHSWFGNLVTCASAPEMWINEGWARFAEIVYKELLYGPESARSYYRNMHKEVLQKTHISDNGYLPVHGVSHNYTYSSTVYDKGGIVVYGLKNYLGDSVFYQTVRAYTDHFKYSTVTSVELRDFFSQYSGTDLTDYFDTWIFRPGFITMIVDSFKVQQVNPGYNVSVWFNQRLRGTTYPALSSRFEVLFLGAQNQEHVEKVFLTGSSEMKAFSLPFHPVATLIDPKDKTPYATTKDDALIVQAGIRDFSNSLARLNVIQPGADSVRIFLRHHWAGPGGSVNPQQNIYRLSEIRYWEIDGNIPSGAEIELRLQFIRSNTFDLTLLPATNSADSIVLLYRPTAAFDWSVISFIKSGSSGTGYLTTPSLMPGQYAFGIGDPNQSNIPQYEPKTHNIMKVFPNPSNGHFTIEFDTDCPQPSVRIFNSMGKQIECTRPVLGMNSVTWNPNDNPSGMYIIQLHDTRKKVMLDSKSVIYAK